MITIFHHTCIPEWDEQTIFFAYVVYLMIDMGRHKVEFNSYIILNEIEMLERAKAEYEEIKKLQDLL